jgi:hypothetical protein
MSYTLRWALGGPDVFKIENIYLKSNNSNITSTAMTGRSSFYPIFSSPPATTLTLKRCTGLGRDAIENLRSYTHIPFPPFYIIEEGKKSAIGVGWDSGTSTTRLSKINIFFQGISNVSSAYGVEYDIEIIHYGEVQYIVQPQAKFDTIEFSLGVVEKPKKSTYIEISNGERSIIITRRKNGRKHVV